MSPATADLCDAHPELQVAERVYLDYGARRAFCGPARTLKVFEDNAALREALQQPGDGAVLVVDGGASLRCALVGGQLGALAARNGWAGLWVHGAVRDVAELCLQPIGLRALGSCPRKSRKGLHGAEVGGSLAFAGVHVRPGDWIYADADGIVVAPRRLHD